MISICESYESMHFCLRYLLLAEEITVIFRWLMRDLRSPVNLCF